ncbi:hypothetical protein LLH00_17735 [bacterium]|nr:hypothetical protein [bacterium]
MSEKDKPQFSRNLEIDTSPLERRTQPRSADSPLSGQALTAEEKSLYFKVEGEKVLQMLALEMSRPEPDPAAIILLRDLNRTWRTLWRGDDSFPVGPFSEMFELAFSILSSLALLGRKVSLEERMLLDDLSQEMSRLVSGTASIACLEACRRLIEKVAPLADRLKEESMGWSEKAPRAQTMDRTETPGRGAPARQDTSADGARADITSSVDEWFDQVTRLMVQPLAGGGAEPAGKARPDSPVHRPAARKPEENPFRNAQIGLFAGEKNTAPAAEKFPLPKVSPAAQPSAPKAAAPRAEARRPAEALPVRPAPTAAAHPAATDRPKVIIGPETVNPGASKTPVPAPKPVKPAPAPEKSLRTETALPEPELNEIPVAEWLPEPPAEVLNYFRELSDITLEVLSHNLTELSGPTGRREVRLAVTYLDDLLATARDFGLESRLPSAEGLRESLAGFVAGPQSGRSADSLRRRAAEFGEKLRSSLN